MGSTSGQSFQNGSAHKADQSTLYFSVGWATKKHEKTTLYASASPQDMPFTSVGMGWTTRLGTRPIKNTKKKKSL